MQEQNKTSKTGRILRVALYCRVSTDEQVLRGHSLQAQEDALTAFAKANKYKVVGIYRDEGFSARKPIMKRKVLLDLLEDVKAGKMDRILFIKLDRWTRNVKEFHAVQSILDEHNVTWQAILEDYSTVTADARLKLNIMLSVAENEADRTGERIRFTYYSRVQKGEAPFPSRIAPYGYHVQLVDGIRKMVKNPETQEIAEYFFHLAVIHTVRYAGEQTNKKYGLRRAYTQWYNMSKNTAYYGTFCGVENYCEPYITKEDYDRMNHNPMQTRKAKENRIYIFAGLLKCAECGRRMNGKYNTSQSAKRTEYYYYRCMNKMVGICHNGALAEMKIEDYLLENIRIEMQRQIVEYEISLASPKVKKKKADVSKLQERLRRINVSYHAGNMTDDEYLAETASVKEAIAAAQKEENEDLPKLDVDALRQFLASGFENIYSTLSKEERRRLWCSIIDEITVDNGIITDIKFRA